MRRTLVVAFAIVLECTLLAGCAFAPNRDGADRISQKTISPDDGILIVSVGAPDSCGAAAHDSYFTINRIGYPLGKGPLPDSHLFFVDSHYDKSDYPDHHGRLLVLPIPAGNYYFAAIKAFYAKPIQIPKYDFSITAGEVVYAGEFWMSVNCVLDPVAEFRDQEQRDMQLLMDKNPDFAQSKKIVKRVPVFSGYAVGNNPS